MNWKLLLPYTWNPFEAYRLLFSNESQVASQAFSALFIHFIIGIAMVFTFWTIVLTISSLLKSKGYLSKFPKEEGSGSIENSSKFPLLYEWKQHLVEVEHRDGTGKTSFRRSVGAAEIFRDNVLAPNLMRSRLFVAIPGILTGLGVLGTFAGLQIGMGGLDLNNAKELDKSIVPLIQGCVIAFSTSVWGVFASLTFSGFEKFLERMAIWRIRNLQNHVDSIYIPYVPEESLIGMERSSRGTEEILKGLAVAIGDEMQKAIGRLGSEIKDAVVKATSEGQGPLMEKSAELLSKTVTAELKNLRNQVDQMGKQFGEQFSGASENLMKSVDNFQPIVENLTKVVAVAQQNVGDAVQKLNAHESVINKMALAASEINQAASNFSGMNKTLEISSENNKLAAEAQLSSSKTNTKVAERFETIGDRLPVIQETLSEAAHVIASFSDPVNELKTFLAKLPGEQETFERNRNTTENERNKRLLKMTSDLAEKVEAAAEQFSKISALAEHLSEAATTLDDASNELATFGQHVLDASAKQNEAAKASLSAAIAGEQTANVFAPIPRTISNLSNGLNEAGNKITRGAESTREFYVQLIDLQKKWFDGVEIGLNVLKDRVQSIISAYGDQIEGNTRNLMNQWTGEVSNCLKSYQSQVDQLQEGLDALQEAISEIKRK